MCELEPEMTTYGYARVSTTEQCLDGQVAELKAAGCTRIFQEKISAMKLERAQLERMMKKIQAQAGQ